MKEYLSVVLSFKKMLLLLYIATHIGPSWNFESLIVIYWKKIMFLDLPESIYIFHFYRFQIIMISLPFPWISPPYVTKWTAMNMLKSLNLLVMYDKYSQTVLNTTRKPQQNTRQDQHYPRCSRSGLRTHILKKTHQSRRQVNDSANINRK